MALQGEVLDPLGKDHAFIAGETFANSLITIRGATMPAIHEGLRQWIRNKIIEAAQANIKLRAMQCDPDKLYRMILPSEECYVAFTQAAKYLRPTSLGGIVNFQSRERNWIFNVTIPPTLTHPAYLQPYKWAELTPGGELYETVKPMMEVASEWIELYHTFDRLSSACKDCKTIGTMFPWIKDILLDSDWCKKEKYEYDTKRNRFSFLQSIGLRNSDAYMDYTERQFNALLEGRSSDTPRLTLRVNQICKGGVRLFAQHRILQDVVCKATSSKLGTITAFIGVDSPMPTWLEDDLSSIIETYNQEAEQRKLARKVKR